MLISVGQRMRVNSERDFCRTEKVEPCRPARSVCITIGLWEGQGLGAILQRLTGLPMGKRRACIVRVVTGAPGGTLAEAVLAEESRLPEEQRVSTHKAFG
jgi:hypothetical protein